MGFRPPVGPASPIESGSTNPSSMSSFTIFVTVDLLSPRLSAISTRLTLRFVQSSLSIREVLMIFVRLAVIIPDRVAPWLVDL